MLQCNMTIQNQEAINRVLYHIHTSSALRFKVEELAKIARYSRFHFLRVFQETFNESVSQYLLRFRLEFAALKLLQNLDKKVIDIAYESGFSSSSTFNAYFKKQFFKSPKKWKEEKLTSLEHLSFERFENIAFSIEKVSKFGVLYIRHKGYDKKIKKSWEQLLVSLDMHKEDVCMFGVHHNYPIITENAKCHYVACVKSNDKHLANANVGFGYINEGYYAIFQAQGKSGDILKLMNYLYLRWYAKNSYESDTRVPMVYYRKNHFLSQDETFDVDFYLPIRV